MAVRYPRGRGAGVILDTELHEMPVGKGEILRHGEDVAIIALGASVAPSLEAAAELAARGIEATVVNARFAKPLDTAIIYNLADRIKRIVTVEENVLAGGFGSGVAVVLAESGRHDVTLTNIGLKDEFVEHGTQPVLRSKYGLDVAGIVRRVMDLFPETIEVQHKETGDKTQTAQR